MWYKKAQSEQKKDTYKIRYQRNPISAPDFKDTYGQDIEPHGKYVTKIEEGTSPVEGWEHGEIEFTNPLIIPWGQGGYSDKDNWKQVLRDRYNKTGLELSNALIADGYDGIITTDPDGSTMEIVDLSVLNNNFGKRKASSSEQDDYDLNELNRDVRLDQALEAMGKAFANGEELDLTPYGIHAIKVKTWDPPPPQEDPVINPHEKRENFREFHGHQLDHSQGIAFAAEEMQRYFLQRIIPTFKVIRDDYLGGSSSVEPISQKISEIDAAMEDLRESAIMQMTRSNDFNQMWQAKAEAHGNKYIFDTKHPLNKEYNQALNDILDYENKWSAEKANEFWMLWRELRQFMFDFKPYIPFGPYWKLWDELTPV